MKARSTRPPAAPRSRRAATRRAPAVPANPRARPLPPQRALLREEAGHLPPRGPAPPHAQHHRLPPARPPRARQRRCQRARALSNLKTSLGAVAPRPSLSVPRRRPCRGARGGGGGNGSKGGATAPRDGTLLAAEIGVGEVLGAQERVEVQPRRPLHLLRRKVHAATKTPLREEGRPNPRGIRKVFVRRRPAPRGRVGRGDTETIDKSETSRGGGGHERPHGVDAEGVGDGEGRPEAAEGVDELRRAPNLPARPARRLTPRAPRAVMQKGPKGFKRL